MSHPILVGYDPITSDHAPVRFGVAAARVTGNPLIIASVSGHNRANDMPAAAQLDEDLCADASEALGRIDEELAAEGIPVECLELRGTSVPQALQEAAGAQAAGLLVVGSTLRGSVGRILPGSTAERLMHGAPCPVAVVPRGWEPGAGLRTIGIGYVDTEDAAEALRGAHALARRAGASLRVITAVKPSPAWYLETEPRTAEHPPKHIEDVEGEHRVAAELALRRAVAALADDVAVETEAFIGDPADILIRVSEHLDLLVCGSRGYGPLRAVLLGGVSRRVAAEAHCPVIVLPRDVKASLETLAAETPGAPAAV